MKGRCTLALVCMFACTAATASAAGTAGSTNIDPNVLSRPASLSTPPPGHHLTGARVLAIAARVPEIADEAREIRDSYPIVYEKGAVEWQVSYFDRRGHETARVLVFDPTARVLEAYTGFKVGWTMARGYPGAFGRKVSALYIWIPLSLLFVAPFVDWRRPRRILHLDLLALSAFSVSLAFFSHADIYQSVPLAYPPLVYLLARMLWLGLRRAPRAPPALHLSVPVSWLAVGVVFLIGFRIALNVTNSNVIDVGYAGVIGASHIAQGKPLYGTFPTDNAHGDTYGPVSYEAYVPAQQVLGFSGRWDDLPAAHATAVFFDLLCIALLFLIGRRVRGPTLGVVLAYAWAAYPFTLFAAESNTNDAIVAALVLAALLLAGSAPARGALAALAGLTKFAPLALAPLLATHGLREDDRRLRTLLIFGSTFAAVAFLALTPALTHGSLSTLYDRTLSYQASRGSPFSVWGLYGGLAGVQGAVQLTAVVLALGLAVVPRRPDLIGLAALSAAIVIALQLGVTHWFYLYIPWFFGPAIFVLLGRFRDPNETHVTRAPSTPATLSRTLAGTP